MNSWTLGVDLNNLFCKFKSKIQIKSKFRAYWISDNFRYYLFTSFNIKEASDTGQPIVFSQPESDEVSYIYKYVFKFIFTRYILFDI